MVEMIGALKQEQEEKMAESHEERAGYGKIDDDSSHGEEPTVKVKKKRKKRVPVYDPHRKRACVDCTQRCVRVHGRARDSSADKPPTLPSFFKIMMGYFSEHMDIPAPFARTILDLAGTNVYLEDAFGLRWRVRVCAREGGFLSFGHGWKNFVLDHGVSVGEFLVFRQIARSVFAVQIFAPSACERMHLCEKNKRQSRKRKPSTKKATSSSRPTKRAMEPRKISHNGDGVRKRRLFVLALQNDHGQSDCDMRVRACTDTEIPKAKCSETSEQALCIGAAKSHGVDEVLARDQGEGQDVLGAEAETADTEWNASVREHPAYDATESETLDRPAQLYRALGLEDENTEIKKCGSSSTATNAELGTPLAMMGLNEVIMDDVFLTADMYEFDSEFCNTEAFSVQLNMEGLTVKGQTSGYCQNGDSSMGIDNSLSCLENEEMTNARRTSTSVDNVLVHSMDIDASPGKELGAFGEHNHSCKVDAEVPSRDCAVDTCKKDEGNLSFLPDVNQAERQENNREGPRRRSTKSRVGIKGNNKKFYTAAPPPDQTWLELPSRLPVLPRTKKHGRKVVILKDPSMRLWPVLYQCTPRFNGFITGWAEIRRENNMQEGDTCEFELFSNSEMSFQVRRPSLL